MEKKIGLLGPLPQLVLVVFGGVIAFLATALVAFFNPLSLAVWFLFTGTMPVDPWLCFLSSTICVVAILVSLKKLMEIEID